MATTYCPAIRSQVSETFMANIAIVDDDPLVREGLSDCLDSAGYTVQAFGSAEEFLAFKWLEPQSCLILDIQLPGISGLELQRRLAAFGNPVPIVFVTAHASEENCQQALESGAAAVLLKPVRREELLSAVRSAIEH